MIEYIKDKIIIQLNKEKPPSWSKKALKRFEIYFFIIALMDFGYFILYEPGFVTYSWFTLNFLIGIICYMTCWAMCRYMKFQIERKVE